MRPDIKKVCDRLGLSDLLSVTLTEKECHELSNECIRSADMLRRHTNTMRNLQVNVYDYLLGNQLDHGIDFQYLDALLAKAGAVLAADADAAYTENGARCSVRCAADELRSTLVEVEPFRAVPRP